MLELFYLTESLNNRRDGISLMKAPRSISDCNNYNKLRDFHRTRNFAVPRDLRAFV